MEMPSNMSGMMADPGPQTAMPPGAGGSAGSDMQRQPAGEQEQQLYNTFVTSALNLLHDKKRIQLTAKALRTQDPSNGVATVASAVITKAAADMQKAGTKLPFEIIVHGAAEIFDNVIEMAQEAGTHDFEKDEQAKNRAYMATFDQMRSQLQTMGLVDQAEAKQMVEEIKAADGGGIPGEATRAPEAQGSPQGIMAAQQGAGGGPASRPEMMED